MNKRVFLSGLAFFAASLFVFLIGFHLLFPPAPSRLKASDFQTSQVNSLNYIAIGDSLTQGVGDSSHQGGFIPLLSQSIKISYGYEVTAANFGVSGNTSKQILKRMQEDTDLQESLAEADLMTLTVGGNDVMAVIRKNLSDLDITSFDEPSQAYRDNLVNIIERARQANPDLPIYVLGIYNPFYLNFPDLTAMQTVVDNWNQVTESTISQFSDVYFIPINDRLYKGINGEGGVTQADNNQTTVINDALFEEDHFHPNTIGYQIMQAAVMEKLNETQQVWQKD